MSAALKTALTEVAGIQVPLLCGAMYPCSNPELVAAASAAGALGIIQPISMVYVHGHDLRSGIRLIRSITPAPVGFNAIIEKVSRVYDDRMRRWIDVALQEGVRFFVTALGDPRWVVDRVAGSGATVFHDITTREHALKALDGGVDGFICVNNSAGGHAGTSSAEEMYEAVHDLGKPLVCAGGIGSPSDYARVLQMGYAGAQLGTRFIATEECNSHPDYKRAVIRAKATDVVLTDTISGVPCSVIKTPMVEQLGTKAGPIAARLLKNPRTKRWVRAIYQLRSLWTLKRSALRGASYRDVYQAGKSVETIDDILSVAEVVERFRAAAVVGASGADRAAR